MKSFFKLVSLAVIAQDLVQAQNDDAGLEGLVGGAIDNDAPDSQVGGDDGAARRDDNQEDELLEIAKAMLETDDKIADPVIKEQKKEVVDSVEAKIASFAKKADEKNKDADAAEPEDIKAEAEEEYEKPETFKGIHEELSWMTLPVRDEPYQPNEDETPYLLDEEAFFDNVVAQGGTQLLSDRPWFIDFFAPWCGHCQRLAPVWDQFHELHQKDLNIGKVDCTTESGGRLCKLFKVPGYPTLLYFPVTYASDKDTIGYWDYTGGRTMEALEAVAL